MNLYRVFPFDAGAAPTERGGALYVPPPSGFGRIDNPDRYGVLYLAADPRAAVAESFGRFAIWQRTTFVHGTGLPYALATYAIPDARKIFNLNDIDALKSIGVSHPADLVTRDRAKTQAWAENIFATGAYVGASWWSYYEPDWTVMGLWDRADLALVETPQVIDPSSLVVQEAAAAIVRQIV